MEDIEDQFNAGVNAYESGVVADGWDNDRNGNPMQDTDEEDGD